MEQGDIPAHSFYAEYDDGGPGSSITGRASWSHQLSRQEARRFVAAEFLRGTDTLESYGRGGKTR